jgi:hypothetical protein
MIRVNINWWFMQFYESEQIVSNIQKKCLSDINVFLK